MTDENSERIDRIHKAINAALDNHDDVEDLEDIDRVQVDSDWEALMLTQDHEILVSTDWVDNLQPEELEAVMVHLGLQYSAGVMADLEEYEKPHLLNLAGNIYNSYVVVHEKGLTLPENVPVPDEDGTFGDPALEESSIENVHQKSISELYEELLEKVPDREPPQDVDIDNLDEE